MITIVIPTFNRAEIISKTLDSVLAQSFQNWECLVVDDFSVDDTRERIETFCQKDNRFRYLRNERKKGAQGARNTGLKHARFDWVLFFDSDNLMHPNLLETMAEAITMDQDRYDVFACFSNVIDLQTGKIVDAFEWLNEGDIHEKLFTRDTYVDYNGAVIRKSKLVEIGGLDEDCPSMQEWDTHIRLSKVARYHTIPKRLVDYYVGGEDAISTDTKREVKGRFFILKKHKKEWRNYKEAYIAFVKEIRLFIRKNRGIFYKAAATTKLVCCAPMVQWTMLKRKIKSIVRFKS